MPVGAQILSVHAQYDKPMMWVQLDPTAPAEDRTFYVALTGEQLAENPGRFIGTVLLGGGAFVAHVFEVLQA